MLYAISNTLNHQMDIEILKGILDNSNRINEIGYKILLACVATVLTTTLVKQTIKKWRLIYLLFIPGCITLYLSLNKNDLVNRNYVMAVNHYKNIEQFGKIDLKIGAANKELENNIKLANENFNKTIEEINNSSNCQYLFLNISLIIFGLWLFLYIVYFIFFDKLSQNEK